MSPDEKQWLGEKNYLHILGSKKENVKNIIKINGFCDKW